MFVQFSDELKRRKDHSTGLADAYCRHIPTGTLFTCLGKLDDARGHLVLMYYDGVFRADECLIDPDTWEIMPSARKCGVRPRKKSDLTDPTKVKRQRIHRR